jgi:hypothetical protein
MCRLGRVGGGGVFVGGRAEVAQGDGGNHVGAPFRWADEISSGVEAGLSIWLGILVFLPDHAG